MSGSDGSEARRGVGRALAFAAAAAALHPVTLVLLRGGYARPAAAADAWSLSPASAGHVADALAATLWPPAWAFRAVTGAPPLPVLPATVALLAVAWAFHAAPWLRPLRAAWWCAVTLSTLAWIVAGGAFGDAPVVLHRALFALAVVATATSLGAALLLTISRLVARRRRNAPDPAARPAHDAAHDKGQDRASNPVASPAHAAGHDTASGRAASLASRQASARATLLAGVALVACSLTATVVVLPRWSSPQAVVASAAAAFPRSARVRLAVAAAAQRRGDDDDAMAALRDALALAPRDVEARRQAGLAYHARGAWAEAARHLGKVVDADAFAPPGVVVAAAEALARSGQAVAARRVLERGVAAHPRDTGLALAMAQFLREHGDTAAAIATLETAVRERPDDRTAWLELARLHAEGRRPHDAVDCWRRVVALSPRDAAAHAGLGRALREAGDLDGAAAQFESALALDAGDAAAATELARILARQGRHDEAAARYATLRSGGARSAKLAHEHGVVLAAAGRDDEATAALREAIALDPGNVDAAVELAWLLATRGDGRAAPEALALARRAAEARPRDPAVLDTLAAAQAAAGDFAAAADSAGRALEAGEAFGDPAWTASVKERQAAFLAGRPWTRPAH